MRLVNGSDVPTVDVRVIGGGTVFILTALSDQAIEWIREHVSDTGYQPNWPRQVVVEHRYIEDILAGMREAGLAVAA